MADKFADDQATLGLMSFEEKRGQDGMDFGKHKGATFGYVYETDSSYSKWAARQEKSYDEHTREISEIMKSEGSEAEKQAKRREQLERSGHKLEELIAAEQQEAQRQQEQKRSEEKKMRRGEKREERQQHEEGTEKREEERKGTRQEAYALTLDDSWETYWEDI